MLKRVIGCSGSGKTEYIFTQLGEALEQGKRCFVIVPEQQSVAYETALCERFGDGVNLLCEVLNFERMPNRVAREFGGLAVNNIDKGGACALLSLVSESKRDELKEYRLVANDPDFALSLFSLISRMKMALVSPETIKNALSEIPTEEEKLKNKLEDISLIYSEYEKNFGEDLSDPRDALTRLSNELPSKPFFANSTVFIDNYYTFTEQEYEILKHIISQSDDVFISFTVDEDRSFFAENAKSAERVKNLSKKGCQTVKMGEAKRAKTETLSYIEKNIWKNAVKPLDINDGSLCLITAKNRFDEVEAVASEILSFVRSGGRFKDVTVLAGNPERYRTIVNSVFSRSEIPCYMSSKEDISTKPIFNFLLSGIEAINDNFSLSSMKNYIKSGYCELTSAESDALLNYATRWKLKGKAWYGEDDWSLDPEGFREGGLSERGEKILTLANQAKNKVVTPLTALRDTLNSKGLTVSKAVRALYQHLINTKADEHLRQTAEKYLRNGERERSEREIQLWKIIINIIDQLETLCGSVQITPKRLSSLIKLMCSCYSLGAIPAFGDAVTFGDAKLIRANGSRLVAVLGACDGEFPSGSHKDSFFNRDEAVSLEGVGLKFAETLEKQLNENRFFVYAALSSPTEKLVLSCPKSEISGEELRPSSAYLTLKRMFPQVNEISFTPEFSAYSRDSVASLYPFLEDCKLKTDIKRSLSENALAFFEEEPKLTDRDSVIEFTDDSLLLSPSRFEKYVLCPFSFFGNYLLDLKEKKENSFAVVEIGNFVHKILELFLKECVSGGNFKRPDENERKRLLEDLSKRYFLDVIGENAKEDKRFMHTYSNMVKTLDFVTEQLCDEFSESEFTPSGFEFKIGLKNADIPPIEYDVDGKRVLLRGSIDRVDTYVKNGVTYVRVADYKTYKKTFSASLVAEGMDTQLLHYLFAYCQETGAKPAGAMYYSIALPNIAITGNETDQEINNKISESIGRSGLFLDDTDIVFAMSPSQKFVPIKTNKDGSLRKSDKIISEEGFDTLSEMLKDQVCALADNVFSGNMNISPNEELMKNPSHHPCKYCALGSLCRSRSKKEEDDVSDTDTD